MANPNIKFFRSNVAPSNPVEGYVWFNTTDRTISLYKNSAWEKYTGKINDITYANGKLTITPHEGAATVIDLGAVGNIADLSSRLGTLETTVNNTLAPAVATLVGADTVSGSVSNKIKTAVEALDATVTGEGTFVDVTVTQTDGKITAVSVAESNIASTSALNTVDQKVDGEITRATNKENELAGAIDTQKGRIDTLVGEGDGSVKKIAYNVLAEELLAGPDGAVDNFTTLQQVAAWIEQHPEDAAAMNEAIGENTTAISGLTGRVGALESVKDAYKAADETTLASAKSYADGKAATAESNAKAYTDELAEVVDGNTTNIATNTEDIETLKGQVTDINTTIEENELTVASALTDLDSRLNTLSSKAITSAEGSNYIETTVTDGEVTVSAVTGSVASGTDALATAADVKVYVDSM